MIRFSSLFALVLLGLVTGCGSPSGPDTTPDRGGEPVELAHPSMGTVLELSLLDWEAEAAGDAITKAFSRADVIEAVFSHYMPDSELNRLQRTEVGKAFSPSKDLAELFQTGMSLNSLTKGHFSMHLYGLLWRKGFFPAAGSDERKLDFAALSPDKVVLTRKGDLFRFHTQAGLDFDGLAKGYALDEAVGILRQETSWGVLRYGSTSLTWGKGIQFLALEDPRADGGGHLEFLACGVDFGQAVSTSSCKENTRGGICHIFDPATLEPVSHGLLQATAVHESAAMADGLSTALMAMGPGDAVDFLDRQGLKGLLVASEPGPGFTPAQGLYVHVSEALKGECTMLIGSTEPEGQEYTEP